MNCAAQFLQAQRFTGEIIVIDDGSVDNTVRAAEDVMLPESICRTVLRLDRHQGKGAAVRSGVMASHSDYVLFADAGLTVPFDNALKGLSLLGAGTCELAFGSRRLPGSIIRKRQDWDRKLAASAFRIVTRLILGIPSSLTDTQCGFKLFRGDVARRMFQQCMTAGFLFDVEIILRALREGYRILEFPVEWTCDRDSRIGIRSSAGKVIGEILRIRSLRLTQQGFCRSI